ncbi:hypothetical protein Mal52_34530 [Symmachiella dynata]|uniref:Uncharacterized protein n=1 Tax=Symmachiella dynata TaxID=2527995 RepID=A0A517ZR68_9PLAN|nr:hypothetical protein Mal52_34530 [Symmachiella dynata]
MVWGFSRDMARQPYPICTSWLPGTLHPRQPTQTSLSVLLAGWCEPELGWIFV